MLQIKLLRKDSRAPSRAHAEDAGLDIYHIGSDITIKARATVKIPTGFSMSVPEGYVGLIYPRSGMGSKDQIVLANLVGVIDSTYRGEVFITMKNNGKDDFTIANGARFAQMLINSVVLWQPQIVDRLPETERGAKGLGGTGK